MKRHNGVCTIAPDSIRPIQVTSPFEPKLLTVIREGYTRADFSKDLVAGVLVGIVALPLAIAFAIASGVEPEQGLYTAVVAGFLISVLSGSRVQIGGPTGAFIVLVYGVVQQYGYDGLATATVMAGLLLVVMGLARLGRIIKYIPYPLTVGFTAGIALIIFFSQIRDFLGLEMESVPADFLEKGAAFAEHLGTVNGYALLIGGLSIGIITSWSRVTPLVPGSLVAIIVGTILVHGFDLPVDTIQSRFGSVPSSLPAPRLPHVSWSLIQSLFSPALAIALLAGIESLLSAVVADGMTGRRHRSDMELVGQGVANIISPLFGGIPATGAIARTATNIKSGGRTPIAGIIHALTLLLIMLFFGRWAGLIPMPSLAAILMVVAYNMSEWRLFLKLFRSPMSDVLVLVNSFSLTVLVDLVVAIQVGVVLAAFLFMRRMADVTQVGVSRRPLGDDEEETDDPMALIGRQVPEGVEVFEINGPFFFGAADKFHSALQTIQEPPIVLILRMRRVLALDATGLRALEDLVSKTRREGTRLIVSGIHAQPLVAVQRAGLLDGIGEENLAPDIDAALAMAREIVEQDEFRPVAR